MTTALWDRKVEEHRETDFTDHEAWCVEAARAPDSQGLWLAKYSRMDAKFTFDRTFEIDGLTFHPPAENELSRHVRLPSSYVLPAPSVPALLDKLDSFFRRCLDLDGRYRFLLSCFVLSTWVVDRLPVAPYIALVGLPRSGKSTALGALRLLCRRSLVTSDISSAAFYRLCDRWMPTLCIDEAATAGQQRTLFHLLRSGTTRDAVAFREKQSYRTFGAKVVVWNQMPEDEALNSRCIVIPMQETSRTDLERTTNADVIKTANDISAELATFRAVNYRNLQLSQIAGAERLRSRDRDLYEALALPIGLDAEACAHLLECLEYQRDLNREPLPARELAVLESSFKVIHAEPAGETYTLRELKVASNKWLEESGERFKVNEKMVSSTLKTFGFVNRRRTKAGWVVIVNRAARKHLHELLLLYGVSSVSECLPDEKHAETCEFCRALVKELAPAVSVRDSVVVDRDGSAGQSGSTRGGDGEHHERKRDVDGNGPWPGGVPPRSGNGRHGHSEVRLDEQVAETPASERVVPIESLPNDGERGEHGERNEADGNSTLPLPAPSEAGNNEHHAPPEGSSAEQVASHPRIERARLSESVANDSERLARNAPCACENGTIGNASDETTERVTELADSEGQGIDPSAPVQHASTASDAAGTQDPTPGFPHDSDRGGPQPFQAVEDPAEVALTPECLSEVLANCGASILAKQRERDEKPAAGEKRDPHEENG